jgi:hypothetical protein
MTHVAARADVAENLLNLQIDFFRRALAQPQQLQAGKV